MTSEYTLLIHRGDGTIDEVHGDYPDLKARADSIREKGSSDIERLSIVTGGIEVYGCVVPLPPSRYKGGFLNNRRG